MSLFTFGKGLINKYPFLVFITASIYNRIFGRNSFKIKGENTIIGLNLSYLKKTKILIYGKNNVVDFGETCYLESSRVYIYGNNNKIILGKRIYAEGVDFHIEDNYNTLTIGDHTSFNGYTHLALTEGKNITIGEDCMFASNITVRTGDSHSIIEIDSKKRINEAKDVSIGEHVWLGNHTIILKGVNIQPHSIIGSGSIVPVSFNEGYVAIAGNPAKIIKYGVDWKRERI